jgi:phage terminase large subunit-like protein
MSTAQIVVQPVREIGDYRFHQYAEDVLSGKISTCKWVKLAAERFINDLDLHDDEDFAFYFDETEAKLAVDFFPMFLRHHQGDLTGEPFFLEPWEQFIVANIYGWKRKDNDLRRFRKVYVSVARKNGKSAIAGGIGVKGLCLDGEGGPRVVCAATKRAQARIVWDSVAATLEQNPELMREFGINISKSINATRIWLSTGLADFIPLGQDSKTEDGHNIHVGIIDEYHEHPDDKMVGVVQTGMGARSQPLLFIITTAGFNIQSPAYEEEKYLQRILEGIVRDDSYFGIIYTLDEGDDWRDRSVWIKSNPNLYIGKQISQIENLITEAENKPSTRLQVLTKELNVWTQSLSTWIEYEKWKFCNSGVINEKELYKRPCYAALDSSMTRDHTVVTYAFPPVSFGERWKYVHRIWVPAESLDEKSIQDGVRYFDWLNAGYISYPGETIIRSEVEAQIREDMERFDVRELAFDRYGDAQPIAMSLEEDGLPVVMFPQSAKEFTAPTNEFERLVLGQEMEHGNNPVMDFYVISAHIYEGPNDTRKPVKHKRGDDTSRIDGVITSIMATWRGLISQTNGPSVYEERGLRIL